jgi:hypothetical protein
MSPDTGSTEIGCWKCGASLAALALPFGRTERCRACGADLHTCKICALYDPLRDKERANFCDHFKPVAGAFKGGSPNATNDAARAALDKLFGK